MSNLDGKGTGNATPYLCISQTLEEWSHANKTNIIVPHDGVGCLVVAKLILENYNQVSLTPLSSKE